MSGTSAFNRLDSSLQEALYRMRWTQLRPLQVDAIHEVFDGPGDLILSARTASGKTEAAFLPILSTLVSDPALGVGAVYVGPLKALINDQFERLDALCRETGIAVHKWHGDVSASPKKKLIDKPSGVLLITPESIESLFVNHAHKLGVVFRDLRFVVIDELHSFIGTERGAHLRSLLSRISARSSKPVRYVGLSATLGSEVERACRWLRHSRPSAVRVIHDATPKTIQVSLQGYLRRHEPLPLGPIDEDEPRALDPGTLEGDLFQAFCGKTGLVFANSKPAIEALADGASREARRRRIPDGFRVHHGSLSKTEREETEEALKSNLPTVTFCSSTLEMGIDVGNVEVVGQVGAPWSVNSLAQRLGRSGRKDGQPSILRLFIEASEPDQGTPLHQRLFPELLQAAAMVELIREHWCEPPESDRLHLSTLVQQVLSVITERGGARADEVYQALVASEGFPAVDEPKLIATLRSMGRHDLIEQTPEGLLISGIRGEKIVRSHDFYVAFIVHEEYRVNHGSHHIGNVALNATIQPNSYLILAGRRWKILDVDQDRKVVSVEPSPGGRVPHFDVDQGGFIHPRVRQKMRELLVATAIPAYFDAGASEMLEQARGTAREAGLLDAAFVQDAREVLWFPWTGTRTQLTLYALGKFFGGLDVQDEGIVLVHRGVRTEETKAMYLGFLRNAPDAVEIARAFACRIREKYEIYLSDDQTAEQFAREVLDLDGALATIEHCCRP
jgi:ATP-dependent Lhr-like helicase